MGFSKTLTLLHFGINNEIVKKSGNKYYIPGHEDIPFTKKTFCQVAVNHMELINTLYELSLPYLREYLGSESVDNDEDDNLQSYIDILSDDD